MFRDVTVTDSGTGLEEEHASERLHPAWDRRPEGERKGRKAEMCPGMTSQTWDQMVTHTGKTEEPWTPSQTR